MKLNDIHKSEVNVVCCNCGNRFSEGELELLSQDGNPLSSYTEDYVETCPHCGSVNIMTAEDYDNYEDDAEDDE